MINGALAMKMTTIQYYRISWLLPVVLPVLALVVETLLGQFSIGLPAMISMGIGIAFSAVIMFLIPYALLVAALLIGLHNRSETVYAWTIALSPLFMTLLVSLFLLIAGSGSHSVSGMSLFYARYCMIVGYCYVSLIFLLLWIFRRSHCIFG